MLRMLQRAGWRLKCAGWRWMELGESWNELDGGRWSWVELGGGGWSWVEVGVRFNNTRKNHSSSKRSNTCHINFIFKVNIIMKITVPIIFRSSPRGGSVKKVLYNILQNSQKNTCARVSFLIKLQAWGYQKETLAQVFSCEFCKFLRTPFLT